MKRKAIRKMTNKERLRLSELAEVVYQNYTRSLNVNIAFLKANVSERDKQILLNDTLFVRRVNLYIAEMQEGLIEDLLDLKTTQNEGLKFQVITKLGKMLYPEKFRENADDGPEIPITPDRIILMGSDE